MPCMHHRTSSIHHGISACISHSTPRRRDVDIHIRLPCIQVKHSHAIAICIIGVRTFSCEWKIIQSCSSFANTDVFHVTTQIVWSKLTVKAFQPLYLSAEETSYPLFTDDKSSAQLD